MATLLTPLSQGTEHVADAGLIPLQFSGEFLSLAILFFVLAILAAAVGARGIAGVSMEIAKWLVILFVALAVIALVL